MDKDPSITSSTKTFSTTTRVKKNFLIGDLAIEITIELPSTTESRLHRLSNMLAHSGMNIIQEKSGGGTP